MKKSKREPRKNNPEKIAAQSGTGRDRLILLFLLLVTVAVYLQTFRYDFINLDDNFDVFINPYVKSGLNWESVKWSFTSVEHAYWFPINRLSHILVSQLFGMNAGWHHFANVAIHALNVALLFLVFQRMTGDRWQSAFVAFVLALHPLHVESVAWVTERKDVLSGLFWILAMWAYLSYVERPGIGRYLLIALFLALGIMSKPMVVTLPFALLLLDIWPLKRIRIGESSGIARIVLEKIPLLIICAAGSVITVFTQGNEGATHVLNFPLLTRLKNAVISYAAYLLQFLWPIRLSIFYPLFPDWPAWELIGAGVVLAAISILAAIWVRRYPYLAVGWLWFLGTLLPVIGLIQAGRQARADRFTYLPLIGISIMLAWGASDLMKQWPGARSAIIGLAAVACAAWTIVTWRQIQYWKDSATVFEHAEAVTDRNYFAERALSGVRRSEGREKEALELLRQAIHYNPDDFDAQFELGGFLIQSGHYDEAIVHLSEAIRIKPADAAPHSDIAYALIQKGRLEEAVNEYHTALRINPQMIDALGGLGRTLMSAKKYEDAKIQFQEIIRLEPNNAVAHGSLGRVLLAQGNAKEAVNEFNIAIRLDPNLAETQLELGKALVNLGHVDEGISHLYEALRLSPDLPQAYETIEYAESVKARGRHR